MNKAVRFRAFLYAAAVFLTPVIDKVGPILEKDEWPSGPRIVWSLLLGVAAALVTLRAFYDGTVERAKSGAAAAATRDLLTKSAVVLLAAMLFTGCATQWIDKVSQTRAVTTGVVYRGASEFNAWYAPRIAAPESYSTTDVELKERRDRVDDAITQFGAAALLLESVEDEYRKAPTNRKIVEDALKDFVDHSATVQKVVKEETKETNQ